MGKKENNEIIPLELLMDIVTGEIHDNPGLIKDLSKVIIKSKDQSESYKMKMNNEKNRDNDSRGVFVRANNEALKKLEGKTLTTAERAHLLELTLYMKPGNKPLMMNNKKLDTKDIADILGMSRPKTSQMLNKFAKLGILEKTKTRPVNFHLSKDYFQMGASSANDKFVKLYQKKLQQVLNNLRAMEYQKNSKAVTKKKVDYSSVPGILQVIMPYFHYQSYYLVKNPDENIIQDGEFIEDALERNTLKHLTKTEIAEKLTGNKKSRDIVGPYMEVLAEAGAIAIYKAHGRDRYLIHPDLMYRKSDLPDVRYTKIISVQFKQAKYGKK